MQRSAVTDSYKSALEALEKEKEFLELMKRKSDQVKWKT